MWYPLPGSRGKAGAAGPAGNVVSNFEAAILALSPTRCYALSNAGSSTTETDLGSDAQNGTWSSSGATQGRPMVIGNTKKSALFDGVAGQLSIPTTNLPVSGAWSIGILMREITYITSPIQSAWALGSNVTNRAGVRLDWGINAIELSDIGASISANFLAAPNMYPYTLYVATFDGSSNFVLNANAKQVASAGGVTLTLAYGNAFIGSDSAGARFGNFYGMYWFLVKGTVITAQQQNDLLLALMGN